MDLAVFERKIGFDRIREMLKQACVSELGILEVDSMILSDVPEEIAYRLDLADEFRKLLQSGTDIPVSGYFNLTPALRSVRVPGSRLDLISALQLKQSLETIYSIFKLIQKQDEQVYPLLIAMNREVVIQQFVLEKLQSIFNRQGAIQDNASQELLRIRREMQSRQQSVHKKIHQVLKEAKQQGIVEADTELSMRDGRLLIPVPSGNKRKIKGFIHDESATGKTAFVEPTELFELNNEIRELELAEQREIAAILLELTNYIRPYLDDLLQVYMYLGKIDFLRAKSLFAGKLAAAKPKLIREPHLNWLDAYHPLLYLHLKSENKAIVPLTIHLDDQHHILLISGPNAGGKSVCLKTVGILQYMLQCGLLIPAKPDSEFGVFNSFFVDIGDEQSIDNDLSTYSSHLTNMKEIVKQAGDRSLILLDEFGAGTEPLLGGAIAESILEELVERRSFGVITTHYTNLKHFALSSDGLLNGAMLYDQQKMEPLFQLAIGRPGSSFAFEIARKIGLSEKIIQRATEKVGKDYLDFDKLLKQVAKDKKYWEHKRKIARAAEKDLTTLAEKYRLELEYIERERKKILKESREEASMILQSVNKKIENAIREIREVQAEKEKTRKIREEMQAFAREIEQKLDVDADVSRVAELKKEEKKRLQQLPPKVRKEIRKVEAPALEVNTIRPGDKVKLPNESTVGEVVEMNDKNLVVAFGNLLTSISKDKVLKISQEEFSKLNKSTQPASRMSYSMQEKRLNFKHSMDVRGMRVDDAIQVVSLYMDDCITLNVTEVKILHGTGNGILRHHIREFLRTIPLISSIKDEHVELGGAGITVVRFDR